MTCELALFTSHAIRLILEESAQNCHHRPIESLDHSIVVLVYYNSDILSATVSVGTLWMPYCYFYHVSFLLFAFPYFICKCNMYITSLTDCF